MVRMTSTVRIACDIATCFGSILPVNRKSIRDRCLGGKFLDGFKELMQLVRERGANGANEADERR